MPDVDDALGVFEYAMRSAIRQLREAPISDGELPDAIASVKAIEGELADLRKAYLAEAPGPLDGRNFRLVERASAKRTYNPDAIIGAFIESGVRVWDVVSYLMARDAVRLTWRWTELKKVFAEQGVTLKTAGHEIAPGEETGEHVGEVWTRNLYLERKDET